MYQNWRTLTDNFYGGAFYVWCLSVTFLVAYYVIPIALQGRFGRWWKLAWAVLGMAFFGSLVAVVIFSLVRLYLGPGGGPLGLGPG